VIVLALSGGCSRAIAFHLGCLRALEDLGLLSRIGVLSTISGGSVVGAYYAYSPERSFTEFDAAVRTLLRRGLQGRLGLELAKPTYWLGRASRAVGAMIAGSASARSRGERSASAGASRTELLYRVLQRDLFPNLTMSAARRHGMSVVIGACELRKGTAFRFGDAAAGDWRLGKMADWDVDVGLAVAASAAYPLLLPTLDRTWTFRGSETESKQRVLLTDGGVYDNLGVQVLEPGRDPRVSIHSFDCEYLIVCSAGQGQFTGDASPTRLVSRTSSAFDLVHRRVQDAAMRRLHELKQSGALKGFVLPYLGQQDRRLPLPLPDLVPRSEVIDYPTNFAAMSEDWIERLSRRGEQMTRSLIEYYLPELL
jgi:NTE family protein